MSSSLLFLFVEIVQALYFTPYLICCMYTYLWYKILPYTQNLQQQQQEKQQKIISTCRLRVVYLYTL